MLLEVNLIAMHVLADCVAPDQVDRLMKPSTRPLFVGCLSFVVQGLQALFVKVCRWLSGFFV